MSEHPHPSALKAKHRQLDQDIQRMEYRPGVDRTEISTMKSEKLKLRDAIEAFG